MADRSQQAQPATPGARRTRPHPLFALLRVNGLAGAVLGLAFVLLVLLLDLGHVRSLAFAAPDGALAILLLTMGSVVTFASVAMGGAIMLMPGEEPKGGPRRPLRQAVPARVRVLARSRLHRR